MEKNTKKRQNTLEDEWQVILKKSLGRESGYIVMPKPPDSGAVLAVLLLIQF